METLITVNEILDRYATEGMHELGERTRIDYLRHLKVLRREFGARVAQDLKPKDFGPFLNVQKGRIQRVRILAVLSSALSLAVKRWYLIDRNVLRDVERHKSRPRDRYVSDTEYEAFKATAPLRIRLAMDLSLLTGQRQGDILSLKWEQVQDAPSGGYVVLFEQAKTGKRLAITVTPALEAVLDACFRLKHREHVMPKINGDGYTSEGFRALWQRYQLKWRRAGNRGFTYHDIRAKSASDSSTIDAAYQRLGHTSIAMTRRVYDRGVRVVAPLR